MTGIKKPHAGWVGLVGVVGLLVANASVTWASDACETQGLSHDCTSPVTSGCNASATTICSATIRTSAGSTLGTVQLRYSTSCRTSWAKTISNVGSVALSTYLWRESIDLHLGWGWANAKETATSNYTKQLFDGTGYRTGATSTIKSRTANTCAF